MLCLLLVARANTPPSQPHAHRLLQIGRHGENVISCLSSLVNLNLNSSMLDRIVKDIQRDWASKNKCKHDYGASRR